MPTLNDLKYSTYSTNSGTTGSLQDVEVAYLQQVTGLTTNELNDLWFAQMTVLGYSGSIQDMQFEYWGDLGYTGTWNDRYYGWLDDGGVFGPSVSIVQASGGSCTFEPPTTSDCTATATYTANDFGFTNPADTWLWTIEPPVAGVVLTNSTLKTCTVETQNSDVDVTFNLKVVATDSVSTDTANVTTAFTQTHTRNEVAPVFTGPIPAQSWTVDVAITPLDTSTYFGAPYPTPVYAVASGALATGLSLDTATGIISGTPTALTTGAFSISCTNSVGTDSSNSTSWTVAEAPTGPAFEALTFDPDTYEMLGVKTGTGGLTSSRTASHYAPDYTGRYVEFGPATDQTDSGRAIWSGAFVTTNECLSSNDLTQAVWARTLGATATFDQVGVKGLPNTASLISDTSSTQQSVIQQTPQKFGTNQTNTLAVWIKKDNDETRVVGVDQRNNNSGSQRLQFRINTKTGGYAINFDNGVGSVVEVLDWGDWWKVLAQLTDQWSSPDTRLYIFPATAPDLATPNTGTTEGSCIIGNVEFYANRSIAEVRYAWPCITNLAENRQRGVCACYPDTGLPLPEAPYLQYYPAATNSLTYSNDLTNAKWTVQTGTPIIAYNEAGLTGEPNTASYLEDNEVGLTALLKNNVVISSTNSITAVYYIKKDSDTSRFPECQFNLIGITANIGIHVNTQTGAITRRFQSGTDLYTEEMVDAGNWWKLLISYSDATGVTSAEPRISPASGTVFGTSSAAAQGSIIVGNVELHLNADIPSVRGLGPIFTTTAAVSTDETLYSFNTANHPTLTNMVYYAEYMMSNPSAVTANGHIWSSGTYAELSERTDNGRVQWGYINTSDVNSIFIYQSSAGTVDTLRRMGCAAHDGTNEIQGQLNGLTSTTQTNFKSNLLASKFTVANQGSGYSMKVRSFYIYTDFADFTEAKAQLDGLMA